MAFTTSGQETEWAYSYSPGAHTGHVGETWMAKCNQLTPPPFKGLNNTIQNSSDNLLSYLPHNHHICCWPSCFKTENLAVYGIREDTSSEHTFKMLVISRTYFMLSFALAASLRVLKQTYAQPRGGIIYYQTCHQTI